MRGGSSRSEDASLFRGIPPTRYEHRRITPWSNGASRRHGGLRIAHERSAFVAAEHSPELVPRRSRMERHVRRSCAFDRRAQRRRGARTISHSLGDPGGEPRLPLAIASADTNGSADS